MSREKQDMSNEQLIEACLNGDARAQKMLFQNFGPKLYAVCLRYSKSEEEAQDMLQDGFVKIFEKLLSYKGEGSFEGWMRRIMVNTCLDEIRRTKKFQSNVDVEDFSYSLTDNETVLDDLAAKDLLKILQRIPMGYRTVFNLYVIEGYSHKEIADELEITVSTSKSQFSRAKAMLREILSKQNLGYES
ncbi:MAG: sigma-70 family RNA polymerase sigma factor [Flavobacteriales bacterium]|nr:sigma-70 family RNA polymerase sigma factor [Flavobacteriales bacterium]